MSAKLQKHWHAQDGRCFYCGAETYLPGSSETKAAAKDRFGISKVHGASKLFRRRYATLEHLKRKCEGGTMANANLVMACQGCNVRRGEETVEAFKDQVMTIVATGRHWTLHPYADDRSRAHLSPYSFRPVSETREI